MRDTYIYEGTTAQSLCKKQTPEKLDKAEGCLLAGRNHSQHSAHCPSHTWESPPGTRNRRATYQAQAFHTCSPAHLSEEACDPCLAWTMLLPILLLVLWMEEGKKTVVIPGTAHTLHLSHLHGYSHSLERHQHTGLLGFISGSATKVHHAAYPPTSGSIARSQLGREARVLLQRCWQAVPLHYEKSSSITPVKVH